jgi:transcriptional regulator with XRE-family HTH domain
MAERRGTVSCIDAHRKNRGFSMNAQAFKAWRKRLGHTQKQAAKLLGVSRRVVAGWESNDITIPKMVALAIWAIDHGRDLEQQIAELDEIVG